MISGIRTYRTLSMSAQNKFYPAATKCGTQDTYGFTFGITYGFTFGSLTGSLTESLTASFTESLMGLLTGSHTCTVRTVQFISGLPQYGLGYETRTNRFVITNKVTGPLGCAFHSRYTSLATRPGQTVL